MVLSSLQRLILPQAGKTVFILPDPIFRAQVQITELTTFLNTWHTVTTHPCMVLFSDCFPPSFLPQCHSLSHADTSTLVCTVQTSNLHICLFNCLLCQWTIQIWLTSSMLARAAVDGVASPTDVSHVVLESRVQDQGVGRVDFFSGL